MNDLLKHKAEVLVALARRNIERDGHLVPVAVVILKTGHGWARALDFSTPENKARYLNAAYRMLELDDVAAVVVMAEAWWVTCASLENLPIPSEHPDRKECINVTVVTRSEKRGAIVPFQREGGRIVTETPR